MRVRPTRHCEISALLLLAIACSSPEPLPRLGSVPDFALVDHQERPFERSALVGQVSVASFVFTRCPTVCPLITQRTRGLQGEFSDTDGVRLVSFSVDPSHDTPAVLREYRRRYGARDDRWIHVTGESEELRRVVVSGFKTALGDPAPDNATPGFDILHSSHFVLIDAGGNLRGFYRSSDPDELERLVRDARRLLEES